MIYAGILAGGLGTRMLQTDLPKQFLQLGEKPVILHTIDQFVLNTRFDEILVAVPAAWKDYTFELFQKYYPGNRRIYLMEGGPTRNDTLLRICNEIEFRYGIREDDVIISHDAVRPFVTSRIINDNIDAVLKYKAVDTVVPACDTIVESEDGQIIDQIPLRSHLYQGQTPQSFNIIYWRDAYTSLSEVQAQELTDAAKVIVLKGEPVHLVSGEFSNMKITTPYDIRTANALLRVGGVCD